VEALAAQVLLMAVMLMAGAVVVAEY